MSIVYFLQPKTQHLILPMAALSSFHRSADLKVGCKLTSSSKCESHSVVSNSLRFHGLYSPWNSLDQNTGVCSFSLVQGIFPTQGSNPSLLYCRQILYQLSHREAQAKACPQSFHLCNRPIWCLDPRTLLQQFPLFPIKYVLFPFLHSQRHISML